MHIQGQDIVYFYEYFDSLSNENEKAEFAVYLADLFKDIMKQNSLGDATDLTKLEIKKTDIGAFIDNITKVYQTIKPQASAQLRISRHGKEAKEFLDKKIASQSIAIFVARFQDALEQDHNIQPNDYIDENISEKTKEKMKSIGQSLRAEDLTIPYLRKNPLCLEPLLEQRLKKYFYTDKIDDIKQLLIDRGVSNKLKNNPK